MLFDDDGTMYSFTKNSKLVRIDDFKPSIKDDSVTTAQVTVITALPGRALGGKFVPNTKVIYFAVPLLGLCRIDVGQRIPTVKLLHQGLDLKMEGGHRLDLQMMWILDPKLGMFTSLMHPISHPSVALETAHPPPGTRCMPMSWTSYALNGPAASYDMTLPRMKCKFSHLGYGLQMVSLSLTLKRHLY